MKSLLLLPFFLVATTVRAEFFDHAALDAILQRTVDEVGLVDYQALDRDHRSALESYLERVGGADVAGWPRPDRLAFFINAYNASMLLNILENPGLKKISEKFSLFNTPRSIAGEKLTLNDLEFRVLLNRKNPENGRGPIPLVSIDKPDPAVHFSIVCGAKGCPPLRPFAYTADNVLDTMRRNAIDVVNNDKYVARDMGKLRLSQLFKWYAKDFAAAGGVPAYITERLDPERREDAESLTMMLRGGGFQTAVYAYDWSLNSQSEW